MSAPQCTKHDDDRPRANAWVKLSRHGSLTQCPKRLVSIDTEWAKNWRATDKFTPFCSAIHSICFGDLNGAVDIDDLRMEAELLFRGTEQTSQSYLSDLDNILSAYITNGTTLVGHQLCSDLATCLHCSTDPLPTVRYLSEIFKVRKLPEGRQRVVVADTRYDLKNRKTGNGEEKLRNVCLRLGVYAVQNELDNTSVTRLYNEYKHDGDRGKQERLQVLNWRHAFQTALAWLVDSFPNAHFRNRKFGKPFLVTNDIMWEMGKDHFEYMQSPEFAESRSLNGIREYVQKWRKEISL